MVSPETDHTTFLDSVRCYDKVNLYLSISENLCLGRYSGAVHCRLNL
jgi:hypothetical protein